MALVLRNFIMALSIVFAGLLAAFLFVPPQIVEISQSQIAQGLKGNLPYSVDKWGAQVTVNEATVQLRDDDKIIINARFGAVGATLEGSGTAAINSSIRYDDGKFYLSDLKHEDIEFEFSANSRDTISDVRSALENILRRETEEAIAGEDATRIDQLARANQYYETKLQADAVEALDNFLSSFPVYNLERAEGALKLAALALDDVKVTSEKILVSLSFQTLLIRLAAIVGSFLLVVTLLFGPLLPLLGPLLPRLRKPK